MAQAARLADLIGLSPTMNWLVRDAIIGAAVGLAAVVIVGTGSLVAVAVGWWPWRWAGGRRRRHRRNAQHHERGTRARL